MEKPEVDAITKQPGVVRNSSMQVRAWKGGSCHHAGSRSAGPRACERSIRQRQKVDMTAEDVALVVNAVSLGMEVS